jgi:outer membrane protein assembly factor BamA
MRRLSTFFIITAIVLFFLSACNGTKRLPLGEKLYTGSDVKLTLNDTLTKRKKRAVITIIRNTIKLVPNKRIIGMRPKLWLYMQAGETPKSRYKKWMKKSGEAPVLLSAANPAAVCSIINAQLFNYGIFNAFTEFSIIEKKHTAKIMYICHIHQPYIIKNILYSLSNDSLQAIITKDNDESLLNTGDDFNLNSLKNERIRIDSVLKTRGYYFFNPDYLLFKADTSSNYHSVSIKLTLKDSIPSNALKVYRINKIVVDQNYAINEMKADSVHSSFNFHNIVFQGNEDSQKIKAKVIAQSIYFKKDDLYSRTNHNITLNRLMTIGDFKFVSVKIAESDTTEPGFLDVTIRLTAMKKHSLKVELDMISKSNNFMGPQMNVSLLNRNTFKGAELLTLRLAGSFEAQFNGSNNNIYSYSLNPQLALTLPQFILPFNIKTNSLFVPKTNFLLSYNFMKKVAYYDMSTFLFSYGYDWKTNNKTEEVLNPVMMSYTALSNTSLLFNDLLLANPFLAKSFEEQFIAGASYTFTYNEQLLPNKKNQYFLQLSSETAGNSFSLLNTIIGENISANNPSRMFGSIYSQYAKLSLDGRLYIRVKSKSKIALRLFAGMAHAYGNTSTLPYSKQFFSGGPNSIRAFLYNSLGPGNYQQNTSNKGILQLGGDVKLEMNAEYRFPLFSYLKGAVFADAGNVWMLKSDPANIGTPFSLSNAYNDIAVGAGLGLRLDVSFFVLRFDLAMPLRKPWLEDHNRWVINQIDLGNAAWRSNNLVYSIAIGYPF